MKQLANYTKFFVFIAATGLIMVSGLPMATASINTPVQMVPKSFSVLADTVSPAVVHIRVEKTVKASGSTFQQFKSNPFGVPDQFRDFFGRKFDNPRQPEFKQPGQGSGFIIDSAGYIVTNNHVVDNANKIKVILRNEKEYDAEIVGRDPVTDIALIKIEAKEKLPTVPMGSSESLKVGEWVAAIGSPFGLEHTVTAGIVSAKGRVIGSGPYDDFIQTDASINPGNSGGPLINMRGEIVGINTMIIAGGSGIGFAIPIDLAKDIVSQLKTDGEVTRGWLGVTIQDLKGDLASYYGVKEKSGVLVASVVPGDPADQAGIQPKDIITKVDGKEVTTSRDLTNLAAKLGVGDTAEITVSRKGQTKTFDVKVGRRPLTLAAASEDQRPESKDEFGFEVTELTPEIVKRFNIEETKGVIVVNVAPDGKAMAAGVQQGDLIIEINRENVSTVKDFKELIDRHKKDGGINLLVKRMNAGLMVIQLA
ncbi:MAG: DegQ family serine endoprotease [Desulfobacterales bacterium]|jgi:serine protease Do